MTAVTAPARASLVAAFAVLYVVWGSTYLAMRIAVHTLPPFLLAGVRFSVAGAVLFVWSHRHGRNVTTRRHWREAALSGVLLLVGGNAGVVYALQHIPSGLAALFIATVPLWMALLAWLFEAQRPTAVTVAGLLGGLAGVAVLLGPGRLASDAAGPLPIGPALVLVLASLSWAAGSLRARRAPATPGRPFLMTSLQMLVGGAVLLLLGIAAGEPARLDADRIGAASLAALAYLIVFGSIVGYSAFIWLLQVAPPARVATYAYVNPVVAVLLGWAVADEPLTARVLVAAALILVSVALITRGTHRRVAATVPPPSVPSGVSLKTPQT